jgi:hypothetical protein
MRAKTAVALDRVATLIGYTILYVNKLNFVNNGQMYLFMVHLTTITAPQFI